MSETQTPETEIEVEAPETAIPEIAAPETVIPQTAAPEAEAPQTFERTGTLADLKELAAASPLTGTEPQIRYEAKRDAQGRSYATGRRKNAVARVWIKPGRGEINVNGKSVTTYFARPVLRMLITQPFLVADRYNQFDVYCTVTGGGLSGQAGALRHGISRALTHYEPELRSILKVAGFLTRDSRVVERKKYGKAKARRSFQFSKR